MTGSHSVLDWGVTPKGVTHFYDTGVTFKFHKMPAYLVLMSLTLLDDSVYTGSDVTEVSGNETTYHVPVPSHLIKDSRRRSLSELGPAFNMESLKAYAVEWLDWTADYVKKDPQDFFSKRKFLCRRIRT